MESLDVLQAVLEEAKQRLGLTVEGADVQAKRARTEIRLDSAWGSEGVISWLLARSYQVTGKFKSTLRVRKLVQGIQEWQEASSGEGGGYYYAILFTSFLQRTMTELVADYDGRVGIEAELKSDKRGLALAALRKRRLVTQTAVVLLVGLAHNGLIWARGWLAKAAPRLSGYGIVRLVEANLGGARAVKLAGKQVLQVRLRRSIRWPARWLWAGGHSWREDHLDWF